MSQEAARPPVKSTYKNLSEVLSAYWNGGRLAKGGAIGTLIDVLHGSPRLTQWVKTGDGYRIWTADESASVTVGPELIYAVKGSRKDDLQDGLPAQSLFNAIETAQQIVQASGSTESDDEYFREGEEGYSDGAALDAALEDTPAAPLAEEDAELIEEVTDPNNVPEPEPEPEPPDNSTLEDVFRQESHTAKANRQNAVTDGVICPHCGNLNKDHYLGECPQCPKNAMRDNLEKEKQAKSLPKGTITEAFAQGRFKSLQGRILTIVDGSFADKTQRDAVKTLINKEFRREIGKVGGGE
jgi:hypothetical protein